MTLGTDSAPRPDSRPDIRETDREALSARARVGLWVVLVAIAAFTLADLKLVQHDLPSMLLVRVVQLALIGVASLSLRVRMSKRLRTASVVAFVGGLYVTSAVAGSLRGGMTTQPITGLAIAFATATTLPWGPWPQLVSVTVAVLAIALGDHAVHGTLAGASPHMAVGLGVAFLVSVYIAHQLERYRRERDAAEAAVRRNEERFRSLIEHGSDVITILDAEGVVRYESPSVERLLDHRAEDLLGEQASCYVHPDDLQAVAAAFGRAIAGHAASVECRVLRPDGSWCDVEAVFTNLLDHPAVGGIVVNWRDIGERTRAEEERARYVHELTMKCRTTGADAVAA